MSNFLELMESSAGGALARQLALGDYLGAHEWEVNTQTGRVDFGKKRVHPIQILGSENQRDGTWMWAWANTASGLPEPVVELSTRLRDHGAELLRPGLDLFDAGRRQSFEAEGDVDLAAGEPAQQGLAIAGAHGEADARVAFEHGLHDAGQQHLGAGVRCAQAHLPAAQRAQRLDLLQRLLEVPLRAPHRRQHDLARRRELHALGHAVEERQADLCLEVQHLLVHGGGREVQRLRRLAHRAVACDGVEAPEGLRDSLHPATLAWCQAKADGMADKFSYA